MIIDQHSPKQGNAVVKQTVFPASTDHRTPRDLGSLGHSIKHPTRIAGKPALPVHGDERVVRRDVALVPEPDHIPVDPPRRAGLAQAAAGLEHEGEGEVVRGEAERSHSVVEAPGQAGAAVVDRRPDHDVPGDGVRGGGGERRGGGGEEGEAAVDGAEGGVAGEEGGGEAEVGEEAAAEHGGVELGEFHRRAASPEQGCAGGRGEANAHQPRRRRRLLHPRNRRFFFFCLY